MNKTIIVTGGRGYLGSRLVSYLDKAGYIVYLFSRNIDSLNYWSKNVTEVNIDWNNIYSIEEYLKKADCIVHLAGANEIDSANDPEKAMNDTAINTYKLLKAAVKNKVSKFIYLSTIHIYGSPLKDTITETSLPRPVHPYAITHRAAEDFVIEMSDKKLIDGIIVRLSNGFGYPELKKINRWKLVINDFCRNAVESGKIVLTSKGNQKRDFIAIYDFCRAIQHLIHLKEPGDIYNLGGDCSVSIKEMADQVSSIFKDNFNIEIPVVTGETVNDSNDFKYCIDKIRKTGFELENPVDWEINETIKKCNEWFGK